MEILSQSALSKISNSFAMNTTNDRLRFFRGQFNSSGELARMSQMLRANGKSIILPYDQFIEHDNRHRDPNELAADPDYICQLAIEGGFNGVAVHYGVAKRYWTKVAGYLPLVVKINGKTSFPPQDSPLSVYTSCVEDSVRLGAAAIGYTMYYGSPRQDEDLPQLASVRKICDRYGMPLIVWAYPRGSAVEAKGGKECSYAIESATRMAMEMGATVVKANLPVPANAGFADVKDVPPYYKKVEQELMALGEDEQRLERAKRVVEAAQGTPVLFSGGVETGDDDVYKNAKACADAGCFGYIYGRNIWKREKSAALEMTKKLQGLLDSTN